MASGLFAKFATVGSATMASRVLGLAREALMAAALGAGPVADVFYTCLRFPNLFRRLFAEGAFNIAFVPLYAKELEGGGEDAARQFARQVFAVLCSWLLVFTGLALIFMPWLAATLVAPGFVDTPEKFDLAVIMTRIMFPYLLFMSLVAMFSGILNSRRRYFLAAIVPVLLNVVLVSILLMALWFDAEARTVGLALAWGVLFSGAAQFALLWWGVRREGLTFALALPRMTAPVKRLLTLMGPALLTGGVLQINLLIGTIIATTQDGANALLNYADRLNQLPLGVIGIAVGVVLLPELSRALKSDNVGAVENLQNQSLVIALALTLPAAVGLIAIPDDIIRLIYERGAFTAETTSQTALALAAFASGLPAYVLIKVFQPAYFAREDMRTPFVFSCLMVAVNVALSLLLFPTLGHVAIALATSISAWVNALALIIVQWRRGTFRPDGRTLRKLASVLLASFVMAGVLVGLEIWLVDWLYAGFTLLAVALAAMIALSAMAYLAVLIATGGLSLADIRGISRKGGAAAGAE